MNIAVVGLGKLGLPMAAYYASKGHQVIGCDKNLNTLNAINNGDCPINETGLKLYLKLGHDNMKVTNDTLRAVMKSDIIFVIVPTPSDDKDEFSNEYLEKACKDIALGLREKGYRIVVIVSTVMPGTMDNVIVPLLESKSGLKCNEDFGVCYNPEFVALGSVIRDMQNPDAILIGESDQKTGYLLEVFHKQVKELSVHRMSFWNAEVAKLALNCYVTTKISMANTLTELCEKIPTGDIDKVTEFLGHDSRIGGKYLKGGLGFGGECFPRDNRAYMAVARKYNSVCFLQQATHATNSKSNANIINRIENILGSGDCISILGLTYKPNTDVVTESAAVRLAKSLVSLKYEVYVYDPQGMGNMDHKSGIVHCCDVEECITRADLVIVATPWDEFKNLTPSTFKELMHKPRVFDCWRIYDRELFKKEGIEYYALGVNDG